MRSLMVSAMMALLSVASPLSPRARNARKTFSRRSRRHENCRNGSTLEPMERAAPGGEVDWESYWASLTFGVR